MRNDDQISMTTSHLLLDHFDHLLATPDAVEQLNQAILDLAVRGKLVSQDPTDESANELLKRIQAEKARLVEEGEVREGDPLSAVDEEETSFQLPIGWIWTRIGEVSTVKGGKRVPKGDTLLESPTEHIYIRVTDMKNGTIVEQDLRYISDEVFKSIERYTIEKTDLYITIAGTIGAVGSVPEKFHGMNLTENAAKVTAFLLNKEYLKIILSSPFVQTQLLDKVNQMAQPKLALTRIKTTLIPLAPLAEQHRIVARVEQLFAQTRQLAALLSKAQTGLTHLNAATLHHLLAADTPEDFNARWDFIAAHFDLLYSEPEHIAPLRQAILELAVRGKLTRQDASDEPASELLKRIQAEKARLLEGKFVKSDSLPKIQEDEKPFGLPKGWEWVLFPEFSWNAGYGTSEKCDYGVDGFPVLRIPNVINGDIDLSDLKYAIKSDRLNQKDALEPNDLLIVRTNGSKDLIGRFGLVRKPFNKPYFFASYLIRYRIVQTSNVAQWVSIIGSAPLIRQQMERIAATSAGQYNVSIDRLKKVLLPLPPAAEQQRIVARVEQLLGLCDALEAKLQAAQTQREKLVAAVVAGVQQFSI